MIYDVCVIGAGVIGSAAAYSLSKKKKNVLLLEQFPVPHSKGSSHGQSRIIRCLGTDESYSFMTRDSFSSWKDLEKEVDEKLFIQNGILEIYDESKAKEDLQKCQAVLNTVSVEYDLLTAEQVNTRFPLFSIPPSFSGIYEHDGGMLLASKCVAALQHIVIEHGGTFKDGETVVKICPGDIVSIETSKGEYKAKSVIIAAGSFTSTLTSSLGLNLPLKVVCTHPQYWKLSEQLSVTSTNNCPSFIGLFGVYGLPSHENPGCIKFCEDSGPVNVDKPDAGPVLSNVTKFINMCMRGVSHTSSIMEKCVYTLTPDYHFIIDVHPNYKNIVIGAGFSGSGFKMAPVTGKILADLALGITPSYDLSKFRICRFDGVGGIKSGF